jgi:sigma-E factor negative regulatory protein RseA
MKTKISALMDGELDEQELREPLAALQREGEAFEAWRVYHLISDAMRSGGVLSPGFTQRVAQRLAGEPTVLAPGRLKSEPRPVAWFAMSAAASLAAVALVGWIAFAPGLAPAPQPLAGTPPAAPVAATAAAPQSAQAPAIAAAQPEAGSKLPALVPPPSAAIDYLLAHQSTAPGVALQGIAPYVRTVSEQSRAGARR